MTPSISVASQQPAPAGLEPSRTQTLAVRKALGAGSVASLLVDVLDRQAAGRSGALSNGMPSTGALSKVGMLLAQLQRPLQTPSPAAAGVPDAPGAPAAPAVSASAARAPAPDAHANVAASTSGAGASAAVAPPTQAGVRLITTVLAAQVDLLLEEAGIRSDGAAIRGVGADGKVQPAIAGRNAAHVGALLLDSPETLQLVRYLHALIPPDTTFAPAMFPANHALPLPGQAAEANAALTPAALDRPSLFGDASGALQPRMAAGGARQLGEVLAAQIGSLFAAIGIDAGAARRIDLRIDDAGRVTVTDAGRQTTPGNVALQEHPAVQQLVRQLHVLTAHSDAVLAQGALRYLLDIRSGGAARPDEPLDPAGMNAAARRDRAAATARGARRSLLAALENDRALLLGVLVAGLAAAWIGSWF